LSTDTIRSVTSVDGSSDTLNSSPTAAGTGKPAWARLPVRSTSRVAQVYACHATRTRQPGWLLDRAAGVLLAQLGDDVQRDVLEGVVGAVGRHVEEEGAHADRGVGGHVRPEIALDVGFRAILPDDDRRVRIAGRAEVGRDGAADLGWVA